jgi:hypothetical protein
LRGRWALFAPSNDVILAEATLTEPFIQFKGKAESLHLEETNAMVWAKSLNREQERIADVGAFVSTRSARLAHCNRSPPRQYDVSLVRKQSFKCLEQPDDTMIIQKRPVSTTHCWSKPQTTGSITYCRYEAHSTEMTGKKWGNAHPADQLQNQAAPQDTAFTGGHSPGDLSKGILQLDRFSIPGLLW